MRVNSRWQEIRQVRHVRQDKYREPLLVPSEEPWALAPCQTVNTISQERTPVLRGTPDVSAQSLSALSEIARCQPRHHRSDGAGIHAAAQKHAQWNVAHEPRA